MNVWSTDDDCAACGAWLALSEDDIFYVECSVCESLIWEEALRSYNSRELLGQTAQTIKVLEITGYIDAGGAFVASPWYTYEANLSDVSAGRSGDYGVYIYDGAGDLLQTSFFNASARGQITRKEGTTLAPLGRIPVDVIVPFPASAARIVIREGERELFARAVSDQEPKVTFTGMSDYQLLSDRVTLTWEASVADGSELFFELWYCPAEDDYYNIAANITGRSLTVDMSAYPGTDEGFFYIFATDGVRTGESDSPWVRVPYKAPDIITRQTDIPVTKITEEILLDVDIYDLQDGWLWDDDEVVWMLSGKEFMTGCVLWVWPYELPAGEHVFTCIATNSAGMSSEREFAFRITDDESDLPNDWSRNDIVNALTNGFVAPINRIDAPITRGQFASLMTTLYVYVSELDDPYPDYEEGVVVDCGQDDYEEFMMVRLGLMDAPGGRFSPNRSLSEGEAALIMYRTAALADPEVLEDSDDLAQIIETLIWEEIVAASGNNAYQAAEKLSVRLALVRVARLFEAIFE